MRVYVAHSGTERTSFRLICTMAVEYTSTLMLYINRLWMYRDLIVYTMVIYARIAEYYECHTFIKRASFAILVRPAD